jgi:(p)ppGpp synthase/HD superfamily hydrolase
MPESFTDAPLLSERFDHAFLMASAHHRAQLRKGTDVPYVSHLLAVASLVLEMGGTEDEAIGALLHDMVEDGGGPPALARIEATFGPGVAAIVAANSDSDEQPRPPWEQRKRAYLGGMATKPADALRVSLADKLHNARSIVADYRHFGDEVSLRFNADPADQLWYYQTLAGIFQARIPSSMTDELRRTVELMREEFQKLGPVRPLP